MMARRISRSRRGGFTLVEALLSMSILAIMAGGITGLYATGLQSLDLQRNSMLVDSGLRSSMEALLAEDFSLLVSDSNSVNIDGTTYTETVTVATVDLDGDSAPEATAKEVTVTIDGKSLSAIVVDPEERLGKL